MRTMPGTMAALAVLLVSLPASAEVRVGALGGLNIAKLHTSEEDADVVLSSKTFPAVGLVLDVDLAKNVSLQFEPMYLQKGGTFLLRDFFGEDVSATLRFSYIELPLFLKLSKASGKVRPFLILGPSAGYRTGFTLKDEATGEEESPDEIDDTFEKWDFGVAAGGGLTVSVGRADVFAEGRYTWGLASLNKDESEDVTLKNRGVQVLVGFTVPIGRRR